MARVLPANALDAQVRTDFSRDYPHIFINGKSLEKIYKDIQIIVNQENHIKEDCLSKLWNEYCFIGADKALLPYWKKFANALFHQGGLLYTFEASLCEKLCIPSDNGKAYIPTKEKIKKGMYIKFDGYTLNFKEKLTFMEIKDSFGDEEDNLEAVGKNYLIKAQFLHHVTLIEENGKLKFQHVIEQPEFKCENSKLQTFLKQNRLSIEDFIKNIISKIFRLKFEPNKASFFQKPYYKNIIELNDGNNNLIDGASYTKITNRN